MVVARHGWVAVVHRAGWVEAAELHAVWVAVVCHGGSVVVAERRVGSAAAAERRAASVVVVVLLASVALVLRRVRVYAVRASADALQLAG